MNHLILIADGTVANSTGLGAIHYHIYSNRDAMVKLGQHYQTTILHTSEDVKLLDLKEGDRVYGFVHGASRIISGSILKRLMAVTEAVNKVGITDCDFVML